jgi:MFS family permease
LLVLAVTHSPAQVGFVAALRALPATLFSLLAGVLVDRWDRKLAMLVCDAGRALSLTSIPVAYALGHLTIWLAWAWLLVITVIVTVIPQVRRERSH